MDFTCSQVAAHNGLSPVDVPEHHPANDPITLTPFHSLSPPGQTETNTCRIKVLSLLMVQSLVARAASGEQVIGPAWTFQRPFLPLSEP